MPILPASFPEQKLTAADALKVSWFYRRFVEEFYDEYGYGHFLMAAYAAVPSLLTPDLAYKIWQNFNSYKWVGEPRTIHRVAVADVLLSPLCREIGFELWEMHQPIRLALLEWLHTEGKKELWKNRGLRSAADIAAFVLEYHHIPNDAVAKWGSLYSDAQVFEALSYSRPAEAITGLMQKLSSAATRGSETDMLRLMELFENTTGRLKLTAGKNDQWLQAWNRHGSLMAAWRSLIQADESGFVQKLKDKGLEDLLQPTQGSNGIEIKIAGGATQLLQPQHQRSLHVLMVVIDEEEPVSEEQLRLRSNIASMMQRTVKDAEEEIKLHILKNKKATKDAILRALQKVVTAAAAADDILIYFSAAANAHEGNCYLRCANAQSFLFGRQTWLADTEVHQELAKVVAASVTVVIDAPHSGTPHWLPVHKKGNIIFASSAHEATDAGLTVLEEGFYFPRFTYACLQAIRTGGINSSNKDFFAALLEVFQNLPLHSREFIQVWEVQAPQVFATKPTLDGMLLHGQNNMAVLQQLLRAGGYLQHSATGFWDEHTPSALAAFKDAKALRGRISMQGYISALEAELALQKNVAKPVILLLFSDSEEKLPALSAEKEAIRETLFALREQADLIMEENITGKRLKELFADESLRHKIFLFYYSGMDEEGNILLRDGAFKLADWAPLLHYQQNLRLFCANTCRSYWLAAYLAQMGVPAAIGVTGVVANSVAADFGIGLFKELIKGNSAVDAMQQITEVTQHQQPLSYFNAFHLFSATDAEPLPVLPEAISEGPDKAIAIGKILQMLLDRQQQSAEPDEEDFEQKVLELYRQKGVQDAADVEKGRWGGKAFQNGMQLTATVHPAKGEVFIIELQITATKKEAFNKGIAAFFVGATWGNPVRFAAFTHGVCRMECEAGKAFTVGAFTEDGTELELDLNEQKGFPEGFYRITPLARFKQQVETIYKERKITVTDDLQKGRWGGNSANGGLCLSAEIDQGMIPGFYRVFVRIKPAKEQAVKTSWVRRLFPNSQKQSEIGFEDGSHFTGHVALFLHNSFMNEIKYREVVDGYTELVITAYEAFTLGAYLENGVELELDLNQGKGYPEGFYHSIRS